MVAPGRLDQRAGLIEADGEAVRDALAGVVIDDGGGGWLPATSAMGTMMTPRNTVTTNETAPHSRTRNDRFTDRECYPVGATSRTGVPRGPPVRGRGHLDSGSVAVRGRRLALALALVQEPDEVLRTC